MKEKKLKLYFVLSIAVIIIVVVVGVVYYINEKKKRLYADMQYSIEKVFNGHDEIVDILYYNKEIYCRERNIPDKYSDRILSYYKEDYNKKWENYYGDIIKLYSIDSDLSQSLYNDYDKCTDGWRLVMASLTNDGVDIRFLFPFGVGYRKQETRFDYLFAPEIEDIVSSNLQWLTQDPMSYLSRNFEKGKFEVLNNKLRHDIENEYYTIPFVSKDIIEELPVSTDSVWEAALLSPQFYNRIKTVYKNVDMNNVAAYAYNLALAQVTGDYEIEEIPDPIIYPYNYVYDNYSRLYIGTTRPVHLKIRERSDAIKYDIIWLSIMWSIIGIVFVTSVFIIIEKIKGSKNGDTSKLPIITDSKSGETASMPQFEEKMEEGNATDQDLEKKDFSSQIKDLPEKDSSTIDMEAKISIPDVDAIESVNESVNNEEKIQSKNKTKLEPYANYRVKIY